MAFQHMSIKLPLIFRCHRLVVTLIIFSRVKLTQDVRYWIILCFVVLASVLHCDGNEGEVDLTNSLRLRRKEDLLIFTKLQGVMVSHIMFGPCATNAFRLDSNTTSWLKAR